MQDRMYIPQQFRVDKNQANDAINALGNRSPTLEILLMVDHAYHSSDPDYDGGLSFLDRVAKKFGILNQNIQDLKDNIRNANDPAENYMQAVRNLFRYGQEDIDYYGL